MSPQEWLQSINTWLAGSPSLNLLFLLLAIVSLVTSFYLFFKSRREKLPVYIGKDFPLIQNNIAAIEGLSIQFNGQAIENLSLTRIAFWNKGRETIHGSDIAHADPVRLELANGGEGTLLGSNISFTRRKVNTIATIATSESVVLKFDYLDYLDGAIIDVYFTGKGEIVVLGTIKGTSGIRLAKLKEDYFLDKYFGQLVRWLPKPKDGSLEEKFLMAILIPISLPIFVPLIVIERVVSVFQTVPKEFELSN